MTYAEWIRQEAALIHADGCTGVTNINGWPCLQHDVEFYYGRSAVSAYRAACAGAIDPWDEATPTTFEDANAHFKAALFRESTLGHLNLMSWWRYGAMRLKKTRDAWDQHRIQRR